MNYILLALLSVSRALARRNRTISTINLVVVLFLLSSWALIVWLIKSQYQGPLTLQLTLLAQAAVVSSTVLFTESSTSWRHYFSKQSVAWLSTVGAILLGAILALITLIPYYFAYSPLTDTGFLVLKAASIILFSLAWSILIAGSSLLIKKNTTPGVLRIVGHITILIGTYFLSSSEVTPLLNTSLQTQTLNTALILGLLFVGLFGFSIAVFELTSSVPDRLRYSYQYSGLFKAFRVFGLSSDKHSVQLTNSFLRWLRSSTIQYRLIVLVICLYAINWLSINTIFLDTRGSIMLTGAIVAIFSAIASFNAVTQSQLHRYHWLPIATTSTAVTNWFAGIIIYFITLAIIYWLPNSFPIAVLGMIGLTTIAVHTITTAVAYRLSQSHQHFGDRLIPLILGSAFLGLIPGLFFETVPVDITYSVLAIWLLTTLILFRLASRAQYSPIR